MYSKLIIFFLIHLHILKMNCPICLEIRKTCTPSHVAPTFLTRFAIPVKFHCVVQLIQPITDASFNVRCVRQLNRCKEYAPPSPTKQNFYGCTPHYHEPVGLLHLRNGFLPNNVLPNNFLPNNQTTSPLDYVKADVEKWDNASQKVKPNGTVLSLLVIKNCVVHATTAQHIKNSKKGVNPIFLSICVFYRHTLYVFFSNYKRRVVYR